VQKGSCCNTMVGTIVAEPDRFHMGSLSYDLTKMLVESMIEVVSKSNM